MEKRGEKAAGILLAAGASVRMGKTKQLLPLGGGTMLARVLNEVLGSDLDKVILVLGHQVQEIKDALGPILHVPRLKVVENKQYERGISSSIIAGLSAVKDINDHAMILLADMPRISSRLINLLLHNYLDSHLPLGAVTVKNKRSHPVIFSRSLFNELLELRGDVGAKSLFQKYDDQVCLVEADEYYDDRDIDTLEDYIEFEKTLRD